MLRIIGSALIAGLLLCSPVKGQFSGAICNIGDAGFCARQSTGVPFALDSSNSANSSNATTPVSLTTANGSGLIAVGILTNAASVSTVTATGLTFTKQSSVVSATASDIELWTAPYSTNFSGSITVTPASASFTTVCALGISGSAASPFDAGGPQTSPTAAPSETTVNANDFVLALSGTTLSGNSTANAPWNQILGINFLNCSYQIVSSTGTFQVTFSAGAANGGIIHAVKKGP